MKMGWVASLSNGETWNEKVPVVGEPSSWQSLLKYCKEKDICLTNLRLSVSGVLVEAMPKKMCDGYFQAYESMRTFWGGGAKIKQGIGSVIGDQVFIVWIDTNPESGNFYAHQEIRPLSEVKIHTTLA